MSFPGIPPLLNKISQLETKVVLLAADAVRIKNLFGGRPPQWGIYKDGQAAVIADSVKSLDVKYDWNIADYPMEKGSFQTYNKVRRPKEVQITLVKGGTDAARLKFLQQIASIASSLDMFDVYMPEAIIPNVNVQHYDYKRTSTNGVGLLAVDIWLIEVLVSTSPAFTNTAEYSGISPMQAGTVQGVPPTPAQQEAAARAAGA